MGGRPRAASVLGQRISHSVAGDVLPGQVTIHPDVAGESERLWATQPRESLGLLYRALLSRLLHDFRLPLRQSHTEGEVLRLVRRLENTDLEGFSQALTSHWQDLAYGHRLPSAERHQALCDDWRRLFATGVAP